MRKIFVIAMREYQAAVKTKAFIISLVLMPVIMLGSIGVQAFMRNKVDITDKKVAVVDYTDVIFPAIEQSAAERDKTEIFEGEGDLRRQVKPRFIFDRVQPSSNDPEKVALELSERVRKKEIFAFLIIGPNVVDPDAQSGTATMEYHSNSPTYDDLQKWLMVPTNSRIQELRFQTINIDREVVQKATRRIPVDNLGLVSVDAATGQIKKAEKTNQLANIFIPMSMMMLMFMVVMIGASPLMQSVLEEKTNRIAEVLLGSVTPFELMMGKLIGMVGVSLTIVTIYLVGAYVAIKRAGYADLFPKDVVWWFIVYQAMAVIMFGAVFIAIGSAVNDMREAQNLMTPVMLVVVSPMFVWFNVVREPSSALSTAMSFFPPATPMLMIIRQSVPPGIPFWQPALGVVLVLLTTLLTVFAAGRIFRVGILMQGKGPKLSEMIRWVFNG